MNGSLLHLSGPVRHQIALSTALGILISTCHVLQGIFLSLTLAGLFGGSPPSSGIGWIVAFAAVMALRGMLLWLAEMAALAVAQRTKESLRHRLLSQLIALGPAFAVRSRTGDLQATIVAGVEALESYYSRYLPAIFIAVPCCLGVLLCLAFVDWPSALLLAGFVAAFPVADHLWLRWRMPRSSGVFAAMGAFGAYLLDSLQGIVTLKAFNAAGRRRAVLAERAAELRRASMATLGVSLARTGLTGFITLGGIALVLSINTWRTAAGGLAPLALFMTLFLAREAFRPLERLEREFHTAWSAGGAAAPIMALLSTAPAVCEPARPAAQPSHHDIAFEEVSFAYGDGAQALSSVSFRVREKEFVALVGPSGAGKSTVIALLLRLFDPTVGRIRIGGMDLRDLGLDALRSRMSVVSQDPYLFHGSIADNLRIAKPDATLAELRAAATAAHLDDFIAGLPEGYATPIGERGAHLSGGQRQRLAIARALLKDAPILLLDEATSSVDAASERSIQQALDTLACGRTTLVIAHRLSTITRASRILVLDAGRLVEQGDPAALASRDGLYARLMAAQGVVA